MIRPLFLIGLIWSLLLPTLSPGQRTLQTQLADILNEIPARDVNQRNKLAKEMIEMGAPGLDLFTAGVTPAEAGNDTRVRAALNGLVWYAGQDGNDKARQLVEKAFLRALSTSKESTVQAFFLHHLSFIGSKDIVPSIEPFLSSETMADYAVQTLIAIRSEEAHDVLLRAYAKSTGNKKLPVLKGIAAYGNAKSLDILHAVIQNETASDLRKIALAGIAKAGQISSEKLMKTAATAVGFKYEPSETMRSWINYLDQLAKNNQWATAEKNARFIVKNNAGTPSYTYALAALRLLITYDGMNGMDEVIQALSHASADYRGAALALALENKDVAGLRKILEKAPSLSSAVQIQILDYVGKLKNPLAIPFVESQLKATETDNRLAAIKAFMSIKGKEGIPALLSFASNISTTEMAEVSGLLKSWISSREIPSVLSALNKAGNNGKIALLETLAARNATLAFNDVIGYTNATDKAISIAAFKALTGTSSATSIDILLEKLASATDDQVIKSLQDAIVSIKSPQTVEKLKEVWTASPANRKKYLGAFAAISDPALLGLVATAYKSNQEDLKNAAFLALTKWENEAATSLLFPVIISNDPDKSNVAFRAYVKQIGSSSLSTERKVLALRKLIPYTNDDAGLKRLIINQLANNKSFLSFITVARFLDDAKVQQAAAQACTDIALPESSGKAGLFGATVKPVLEKCMVVLSGAESDYTRENIRTWMAQMPASEGFVSMFNGKDLSGWQGLVENPIARAAMSPEVLKAKQKEADAKLPLNWTVVDGEIRFTGTGYENLCSVQDYADFEMWVDWRISKNGDSGIYLRGTPQVQIWDTMRVDVGANVGSGGLYNNKNNPSKPLKLMDNAIGDWNTFFIRMIGEKVTVYLNGELVVDNVTLENYWDRKLPIFPSGPIELQAHGTDLAFRDVYVRKLNSSQISLTPEEETNGFVSLFNGKDLTGWVGNMTDYKVVDQTILIDPTAGGKGNLYTEKEYDDFVFRFDFQLTPGANNGIGIRTPLEGDAAYVGMEIQVLDNTSPIYANLEPYQYHGSVYGVIPAKREFLKPVGQWNEEEIRIEGNRIRVTLNGQIIVDGDLMDASSNGTLDHKNHPGLQRTKGHIGFLGHGSEVRFKNLRIKSL
jgi:HEAT repeat protein